MTPTYSQQQREYWSKRPADILQLMTVEFYHPDFGFIRLLANQFNDQMLDVNGTPESFQAVSMQLPKVTNQSTDDTRAGAITFGRIGLNVRQKLLMITPLGSITNPIKATLRTYEDGSVIFERRLYVNRDGVAIGVDNVSIQLSIDNPAKLTNELAFYDPGLWTGLKLS